MTTPFARVLPALLGLAVLLSLGFSAGPIFPGDRSPQEDPPPPPGHVIVKLLDEDGEPIFDARVSLGLTREQRDARGEGFFPVPTFRTNLDGMVSIEVESGKDRELTIISQDADAEIIIRALDALEPGAERDLELVMRSKNDAVFTGSLVDDLTGAPIVGARIRASPRAQFSTVAEKPEPLRPPENPEGTSDESGTFNVPAATWRTTFLEVYAPGYSVRMAAVGGAQDAPGLGREPLLLRLQLGATLAVNLLDAPGGTRVHAEFSCRSFYGAGSVTAIAHDSRRTILRAERLDDETDAVRQQFVLRDLPANTDVQIVMKSGMRVLRKEASVGTPGAGEERRMSLDLSTDGRVEGVLIDETGAPLAGRTIWVGRTQSKDVGRFYSYLKPYSTQRTDEEGRFTFTNLPIGRFLVAPEPPDRFSNKQPSHVIPGAVFVIEAKSKSEAVKLKRLKALTLSGVLTGPDGEPTQGTVSAQQQNGGWTASIRCGTDDGSFTLGGLIPGMYEISGRQKNGVRSLPLLVEAGAEDLVLQSRPAGSIEGIVINESTKAPVPAVMLQFVDQVTQRPWLTKAGNDGTYGFRAVPSGDHFLSASTPDGLISRAIPVHLEPGESLKDLTVELAQGSILEIRAEPREHYTNVVVRNGSGLAVTKGAAAGEIVRLVVPAGPIDVTVMQMNGQWKAALNLDLKAGETHREEVTLERVKAAKD